MTPGSGSPLVGGPSRAALALAYGLLVVTAFAWATNVLIGRALADTVPPFTLSFLRWGGALLLLLAVGGGARLWRQRAVARANLGHLTVLGFLSVTVFHTILYAALQHSTAINIGLINASGPVLIVLLSWWILGRRLTPLQSVGLIVAVVGTLTVLARGVPANLLLLDLNRGDAVQLIAVAAWAFYSVLMQKRPVAMHPLALLTALALAGLPGIAVAAAFEYAAGLRFPMDPTTIGLLLYIVVLPTVLAQIFWNHGIATVGANRTGFFNYLVPAFVALLAVPVLGEALQAYHLLGFVLILGGVTLALTMARPGK